ncbi:GNAT family N-acetyltransferase [Streptomyces sp. NPDC091377]|uniref:GNAT family N-acetyltransferase n=1 Tax=Streptomyces sp. NPDC091377 TaxID=3365995 RepID=UPI0038050F2D
MRSDDWHLSEDLDGFLDSTGDFLRSRAALHTTQLTVLEKWRKEGPGGDGSWSALFGRLEGAGEGEVHGAFYRHPRTGGLTLTALSPEQTDTLAARLAGLGHAFTTVLSDEDTADAFAAAWQRHTGVSSTRDWGARLHRLGALTPPEPRPEGRGRLVGEPDREQLVHWCAEFCDTVGEVPSPTPATWHTSRFADRHFTFWETPDGTPVSMAARTSVVGDMVRVDPVYTPAHLRARGYAGAVTVAVTRAALEAGAKDVVLFTDPANVTSNALYRRIGYVPIGEFKRYRFSDTP